ncbi:MAG: hypothetical protein HZA88_01205 [Verrucomicrobia bacterium]|nr:hypothetical protein [Verrucomicrobiota bacterium]
MSHNANVTVTSISIPSRLAPKIRQRVRDLKREQEITSVSDYFTKLAFRDIRSAASHACRAGRPPL